MHLLIRNGGAGSWNRIVNIAIVVNVAILLVLAILLSIHRVWRDAGLASAVATAAAPAWQHAPRRPSTGYVFHSAEHPDLAERLFFVVSGFFAPDSGLTVVDRTELHIVDMASGENRVLGRKGGGPEEFSHITRSFRTSEGVASFAEAGSPSSGRQHRLP